jgi:hypothetical protein
LNWIAILSAASWKALAVDPKMGLFVVGREVRERNDWWGSCRVIQSIRGV